jgi:hypothetical protein
MRTLRFLRHYSEARRLGFPFLAAVFSARARAW